MELLRHRVKEIITEYPFFTKAEQFFVRVLEIGLARRCCLITSNDTVFSLDNTNMQVFTSLNVSKVTLGSSQFSKESNLLKEIKTNTGKLKEISFVVFNRDLEGFASSSTCSRNEGKRGKCLKRKEMLKNNS